jgi:hypothetical protein
MVKRADIAQLLISSQGKIFQENFWLRWTYNPSEPNSPVRIFIFGLTTVIAALA